MNARPPRADKDARAAFLAALEEDIHPLIPGRPRPTPAPAGTEPSTGGAA